MNHIRAIILAAMDIGGMNDYYFEGMTRHTMPLCRKSLIEYQVDILAKLCINDVSIVIDEKINNYEKLFPCDKYYSFLKEKYPTLSLNLVGQNNLANMGAFEAVRACLKKSEVKRDDEILILFGDTFFHESLLSKVLDQYAKEEDASKIIWGLLVHEEGGRGDVVVRRESVSERDFGIIDEGEIINIFECQIDRPDGFEIYLDSGIIVMSGESWENIKKVVKVFHRPSSYGIFSMTNLFKQALSLKNIKLFNNNNIILNIKGLILNDEIWYDVNYPWDLIDMNNRLIREEAEKGFSNECLAKVQGRKCLFRWNKIPGEDNAKLINFIINELELSWVESADIMKVKNNVIKIIKDINFLLLKYDEQENKLIFLIDNTILCKLSGKFEDKDLNIYQNDIIYLSKGRELLTSNNSLIIGPCIIGEGTIIGAFATIENSCIGKYCTIGDHSSIANSNLENGVNIHDKATIEGSVIREFSEVFCHSLISRSVIGKKSTIGNHVRIPCKRLNKIVEKETIDQNVVFFADTLLLRPNRFGAIIGDYCQIGSGTIIHPGRKIGKRTVINANCQIINNIGKGEIIKQ